VHEGSVEKILATSYPMVQLFSSCKIAQYEQCMTVWLLLLQYWKQSNAPIWQDLLVDGSILSEERCEGLFGQLSSTVQRYGDKSAHPEIRKRFLLLNKNWETLALTDAMKYSTRKNRVLSPIRTGPHCLATKAWLQSTLASLKVHNFLATEPSLLVKVRPNAAKVVYSGEGILMLTPAEMKARVLNTKRLLTTGNRAWATLKTECPDICL
jgi:hypothetical protein